MSEFKFVEKKIKGLLSNGYNEDWMNSVLAISYVKQKKYNDDLKYLITFVAGGNNGAVYKADNWSMIGETAGLPKHKSVSMKWHSSEELKELYVKPTGEDKKLIFIKEV